MVPQSKVAGIVVSAENPQGCNQGFLYRSTGESAMKTYKVYRTMASQMTVIGAAAFTAVCVLANPAQARWAGGYGGGGGLHYGGDGFGGGDPSSSARASEYQSYHSTNQSARFNEANSMNQTRYNEAQSMQNQHYQNESALSHQQYNQASNLQSNSHYDPYGSCCGSSGGSAAGAAAVGMMGGMAMGSMMRRQQQPTTVVNEYAAPPSYGAPPYGAPPSYPPPQGNYRPFFNGSQVVYGQP
jgi:hypothetical protein